MSNVKSYLSLIKFSHTIFAMPFAMIGFFLGLTKVFGFGPEYAGVGQWNLNKTIGWGFERDFKILYSDDSLMYHLVAGANPIFLISKYYSFHNYYFLVTCVYFLNWTFNK